MANTSNASKKDQLLEELELYNGLSNEIAYKYYLNSTKQAKLHEVVRAIEGMILLLEDEFLSEVLRIEREKDGLLEGRGNKEGASRRGGLGFESK